MVRPTCGDFILYDSEELGLIVAEITNKVDNDLVRMLSLRCVVTGRKLTVGLFTQDQIDRVKRALTEMEVLAWLAK